MSKWSFVAQSPNAPSTPIPPLANIQQYCKRSHREPKAIRFHSHSDFRNHLHRSFYRRAARCPAMDFEIHGTSHGFGKPSTSSRLSCDTGFDQKGWDLSVCWERRIKHAYGPDSNANSRLLGWSPFALYRDGAHDHE